jgi:WD40 repeat protein
MNEPEERYAAFVSYRHISPDREWAARTMKFLESYKTPRSLITQNYPARIGRLFRDEDEIPASSDLSQEIKTALQSSRNLIVICSPETPNSAWVRGEIDYFQRLGKGDRIIALLIAGEPSEAFPAELRRRLIFENGGTFQEEIEPIAADVRPRTKRSPKVTEQREFLRLAAALLGCRFDDLVQRDAQRRRRRLLYQVCTASFAGVLIGGAGLLWWRQLSSAAISLARTTAGKLAEQSAAAQNVGNDDVALRLAVLAANMDPKDESPARLNLMSVLSKLRWRAVLRDNTEGFEGLSFSAKGDRIAGFTSHALHVWEIPSGKELPVIYGFKNPVHRMQLSPDGTRIVAIEGGKAATIWDVETGKEAATLKEPGDGVPLSAEFSPDGVKIVTASSDGACRVWDATSGAVLTTFTGHNSVVNSATFSPDGSRVASASVDETVRVWDAATGKELLLLKGQEGGAESARFSPGGKRIVSASGKNEVKIWDAESGKLITTFPHAHRVISANFDSTGHRVVTVAFPEKVARIWDAESGAQLDVLSGHGDTVMSAAFEPAHAMLATASLDKTIRFWSSNQGGATAVLLKAAADLGTTEVKFGANDSKIIATSDAGFEVWDAKTVHWIGVYGGFTSFNKQEVSTNKLNAFYVKRDYTNGRMTGFLVDFDRMTTEHNIFPTLKDDMNSTFSNLIAEDGSTALIIPEYGDAALIDTRTGITKNLAPCVGPRYRSRSVGPFSPDMRNVFVFGDTVKSKICDLATGQSTHEFDSSAFIQSGRFSHDGKSIIVAGERIRLVETANWKEIRTFSDPATQVHTVSFNREETQILGALDDGTIRIWDTATARELLALHGHSRSVQSAAFSSDGARIVSSSRDETVRLWDVPFLKMSRDELIQNACQRKLVGASAIDVPEAKSIGLDDSHGGVDVCDKVTREPDAFRNDIKPLFSAPTPADMLASVAPIKRLDILPDPVWNTPDQRVPANLIYNPLEPQPPDDPFKEPVLPPRVGQPNAMDVMVDKWLAKLRALCNSGKGFKIGSSIVRDEKGKVDNYIKKDEIFTPLRDNASNPKPGLCHVKYSDNRTGYVGLTTIILPK